MDKRSRLGVPTKKELGAALERAARLAIRKKWRGNPGPGRSWEDLRQEVISRAFPRVRRFRHGGKFTLFEYCYFACYCRMIDVAKEDVKAWKARDSRPEPFS